MPDNLVFAAPWAFMALLALPLLWWLLRLTPPRPKRILFGAFPLLKNLTTNRQITARAPWWLWLLRLMLATIIIIAAATPQLETLPTNNAIADNAPLVLIMDNDAIAAANWPWLQSQAKAVLADAAQNNRPVLWLTTTGTEQPNLQLPANVMAQIDKAIPQPWLADLTQLAGRLTNNNIAPDAEIIWLSGGAYLDFPAALPDALANYSKLTVLQPPPQLAWIDDWQNQQITVQRFNKTAQTGQLNWLDATGHLLGSQTFEWPQGQTRLQFSADLPTGKTYQIHAMQLAGQQHAGGVWLLPPPGLPPTGIARQISTHYSTPLLDPVYYLNNSLQSLGQKPQLDRLEILLNQHIPAIILPDLPLTAMQQTAVHTYIEQGGLIIRWLGQATLQTKNDMLYPIQFLPQLRRSHSLTEHADVLRAAPWPVRSWLQDLSLPDDLAFTQIMDLLPVEQKVQVLGSLQTQAPWLAAKKIGKGQLIAVYTTATPEWSNLPITALMPALLGQLLQQADPNMPAISNSTDKLVMQRAVNAFGQITAPPQPIPQLINSDDVISANAPAGKYQNNITTRFLNMGASWHDLEPFNRWPANTQFNYQTTILANMNLNGYFWLAALLILLVDTYVTLSMRGLLPRLAVKNTATLSAILIFWALPAQAETANMALGYLNSDNAQLPQALTIFEQNLDSRTTAQLAPPVMVNPEQTSLAPYPILFWAPTGRTTLSARAAQALQQYLATGGMLVLFAPQQGLSTVIENLQLPALQQLPDDHVLWHSFYLLKPGSWLPAPLWLDQPAANHASQIASTLILPAELLDNMAAPLTADREPALRLLINIAIYALTGDYKSDQVHLPYILERLGGDPPPAKP